MLNLAMESLELGDTILLLVSLVILIFLVAKYAYVPVSKMLEKRRQTINNDLDSAQSMREDAQKLAAQRQKELNDTHESANEIIQKAETSANKERSQIIKSANEDAEKIRERTSAEVQTQKEQMLNQVKDNLVDVSTKLAANILQEQLDESKQEKSVNDFLQKLEAQK